MEELADNSHHVRPDAIFIDTNLLIKLLNGNGNSEFLKLQELAQSSYIDLIIPETVLHELAIYAVEKAKETYHGLNRDSKALADLLMTDLIHIANIEDIERKARESIASRVQNWGMSLACMPPMDLKILVRASLMHIPPFEKGDKGFKDTLIIETILNESKLKDLKKVFFISDDGVFKRSKNEIARRFEDQEVEFCFFENFTFGHEELSKLIDTEIEAYIQEEEKRLESFLKANESELFEYVSTNASFNSCELEGTGPLAVLEPFENPILGNVLEIKAKRPKSISSFHRGWLLGKAPSVDTEEPITITVDVEIDVVVEENPWRNEIFGFFGDQFDEQGKRIKNRTISYSPSIHDACVTRKKTVLATITKTEGIPTSIIFNRIL